MMVKGALEWEKFKAGKPLTRKQAVFAQCYSCNGFEGEDCQLKDCPLYQWSPFNKLSKFTLQSKQKPYPKALIEANRKRKMEKVEMEKRK
jgi:hypothetical protein